VAVHAVGRAGPVGGQTAVVFGGGPIGLLITSVLRASGASRVVLVEPHPDRRRRGVSAGAEIVVDPTAEDVHRSIEDLTAGTGADVAFECVGAGPVLASCLDVVKSHGTVVNVGIATRPVEVDLLPLVLKEITLVGTICYDNDHPAAIEMLRSASVRVEQFITKRVGLDDLEAGALQPLLDPESSHVKILVSPHA
jgi:(R,R)-butanediol dehydrogenase/meso-butanediol dehydrogenase/diacetyl reductase